MFFDGKLKASVKQKFFYKKATDSVERSLFYLSTSTLSVIVRGTPGNLLLSVRHTSVCAKCAKLDPDMPEAAWPGPFPPDEEPCAAPSNEHRLGSPPRSSRSSCSGSLSSEKAKKECF